MSYDFNADLSRSVMAGFQHKAEQEARIAIAAEIAADATSGRVCAVLAKLIVEFESTLDADKEVGMRLVAFGQAIVIHVRDLGYEYPHLIVFYGVSETGKPMHLIQNVAQLSFLLTSVDKINKDEDRMEFGYHAIFEASKNAEG